MYIGVLAPIATSDLFGDEILPADFPAGRSGAPLISALIHEYVRQGHKVLAISLDDRLQFDAEPYVFCKENLTFVVLPRRKSALRLNGRKLGRTVDLFKYERAKIQGVLNLYHPEVIHAHWTYEYALAALDFSKRSVITIHDNAGVVFSFVRDLNRFIYYFIARLVFLRGRRFTAVSPYMASSVSSWTKSDIRVVGNPVSVNFSHNPYKFNSDSPIVVVVNNGWDERKNCEKGLLAFKMLRVSFPKSVLWAIGTAFDQNGKAVDFCKENSIENVVFLGSLSHKEVLARISTSSVLLHTSLEESFGMVLAEAMACGVPVVAGKHSGAVPWVVGDSGVLVDVRDIDAICKGIKDIFENADLREELSRAGRCSVQERFSVDRIASEYLQFIRESI